MPGGGVRVVTRFRVTPGVGTPADQMPLAGVIAHGGQLTTARRAVRRKARGLRPEGPAFGMTRRARCQRDRIVLARLKVRTFSSPRKGFRAAP